MSSKDGAERKNAAERVSARTAKNAKSIRDTANVSWRSRRVNRRPSSGKIPTYICSVIPTTEAQLVEFRCPHCKAWHHHAWPDGETPVGPRLAHCWAAPGFGYFFFAADEGGAS